MEKPAQFCAETNNPINKSDANGHLTLGDLFSSSAERDKTHEGNASQFDQMAKEQRSLGDPQNLVSTYEDLARRERQRIGKTTMELAIQDGLEVVESASFGLLKGLSTGAKTAGVVGKSAPISEGVTVSVSRPLTVTDLGVKGTVTQLNGTLSIKDGVATVTVDMIEGKISNPMSIVRNLSELAKANGATSLKVEGTLANPALQRVLQSRYGLVENGGGLGIDSFTIPLR